MAEMRTPGTYMDGDRAAELWTAIQTALAGKANLADLNGYTTPEAVATAITTALSAYATNAAVQAEIAAALAKYMTASEINDAIAGAVGKVINIRFEAVDSLPEAGEDRVIYLVPNGRNGNNQKSEYMWIDGKWEVLGDTMIDLTAYWSKNELRPMTAEELQAILV